MQCVECGGRLAPAPSTGRPRKYCSRSCQARAYRRRRDQGRLNSYSVSAPANKGFATAIEAAIAIADEQGISATTLRSIAARSNVALAAVQREFGSRDRLVASMVQRIFTYHRRPPLKGSDPVSALSQCAEYEWQIYRIHPWLVSVMASTRPPMVPAVLDAAEDVIEVFRSIGLGSEMALDRYLALSAYIQGMGLLLLAEHDEAVRAGTSYQAWWSEEIRRQNRTGAPVQHTRLAELTDRADTTAFDANACFHHGLERIVQGLVAT